MNIPKTERMLDPELDRLVTQLQVVEDEIDQHRENDRVINRLLLELGAQGIEDMLRDMKDEE